MGASCELLQERSIDKLNILRSKECPCVCVPIEHSLDKAQQNTACPDTCICMCIVSREDIVLDYNLFLIFYMHI